MNAISSDYIANVLKELKETIIFGSEYDLMRHPAVVVERLVWPQQDIGRYSICQRCNELTVPGIDPYMNTRHCIDCGTEID